MRGGIVVIAASIAITIIAPGRAAHAGRTFYGWLQGTEVMPERGAEINTFVSEENRVQDEANQRTTNWWISPLIGVTDQVELGLPVQFDWTRADNVAPRTNFVNFGAELRFRMVTPDPVDKPDFVPLVRVGVKRLVAGTRDLWQPELEVVGSYETGRVHAIADLSAYGEVGADSHHFAVRPGAGVSIEAIDDLRIGAEVFGEISLDDNGGNWAAVGPNLAWSHGRTWISAAYGIGVYKIRDAPRINWGIAF